ncbi:hypothetical protein C8F04DRAFT_1186122 [Mycena alexandri]|uniref:Uncharacterized protein n=1 Tax=Mycena alexandri TaxID=1745969 RepID=A0AAD6ST46_9AGAR|nr:hypothetical protein C8F04DRAFT_1186122 [Mycena alexandri]
MGSHQRFPSKLSMSSLKPSISRSLNPGALSYRRELGSEGLVLRWSTAADKAGCVMVSCLAALETEGQESESTMRYYEPFTDDAFHAGSSNHWALCVDTSPSKDLPSTREPQSYAEQMRMAAKSAPERVVALVYLLPTEFSFDSDAVRVPVGRTRIVACQRAYRGETVMKALFDMVNARAAATGCAFMLASGAPGYYRTYDYEYAINVGRGLVTHVSDLRPYTPPADDPFSYNLREATLDDLPAIERLVQVLAPRANTEIFIGVKDTATLRAQLRWALGDRPEAYSGPEYPVHPFFVLEKCDVNEEEPRIVAAAGLTMYKRSHGADVSPLLWDGMENVSAVVQALVPALINAGNELPVQGRAPGQLETLDWTIADAHPLRRWLMALQLAVPTPETSRFDPSSALWVSILSLPRFLSALVPALNARLAAAVHIFGANYTAALHISASRAMGGSVILRVTHGAVSIVSAANAKSDPDQKVSLPRAALIQLLMGYASWCELKKIFPDVAVEPAAVPLVEVLFPKRSVSSSMHL